MIDVDKWLVLYNPEKWLSSGGGRPVKTSEPAGRAEGDGEAQRSPGASHAPFHPRQSGRGSAEVRDFNLLCQLTSQCVWVLGPLGRGHLRQRRGGSGGEGLEIPLSPTTCP